MRFVSSNEVVGDDRGEYTKVSREAQRKGVLERPLALAYTLFNEWVY